jgi:aryl-alcohol dehydrogenase-like predicted oxidoreductase
VATKGRFPTGGEPNAAGLSRRHLDRALAASLGRLGVDTIDLYQVHAWDPLTPLEETLSFLDDATRAGKIRYAGLSNYHGWQLQKAVDLTEFRRFARPVTLQTGYSLLSREVEWEITSACQSTGLGVLAFSPLAAGILTGKYQRRTTPTPGWPTRGWAPTFESGLRNSAPWTCSRRPGRSPNPAEPRCPRWRSPG